MRTLVIDASVAAKWALPGTAEPYAHLALDLLRSYAAGKAAFIVPDLFWTELANVFWKAARQNRWAARDGQKALKAIRERRFITAPSQSLIDDAYSIATAYNRTVYDSIYVALALVSHTDLVTADERLANALAAYLPVRWLGSWQ